jgi:hypothetical protein
VKLDYIIFITKNVLTLRYNRNFLFRLAEEEGEGQGKARLI